MYLKAAQSKITISQITRTPVILSLAGNFLALLHTMESMYNDDLHSDDELEPVRCIVCAELFTKHSSDSFQQQTCGTCIAAADGDKEGENNTNDESGFPLYDPTVPPRRIRGRVAVSCPFGREGIVYKLSV